MATPSSTKKFDWGELLDFNSYNSPFQGSGGDADLGAQMGQTYGGSGLIFLGNDYSTGTQSFVKLDPYLTQESQYGTWDNLRGDWEGKINEVAGFSADAMTQLNDLYNEMQRSSGGSLGRTGAGKAFTWQPGSGDYDSAQSNRDGFMTEAYVAAQGRQKYDNLAAQFNSVYSGAIQKRDQDAAAHSQRLAELDAQRVAAEQAAARNRAWASNMGMQNRQEENVPDTITSGTAAESAATAGDGTGGDDKRRRGRGALSSNLGLNA